MRSRLHLNSPAEVLLVAVWTAVLFGAGAAGAQDRADPAALLQQARGEASEARFEQAVSLLRRARSLDGTPAVMALVQLHLGINLVVINQQAEARLAFRAALQLDPQIAVDSRQFKPSIVALFEQVRRGTVGRIRIRASAPGVAVSLDGQEVGEAPLDRFVLPGLHQVAARSGQGGPLAAAREVRVAAGEELRVTLAPADVEDRPVAAAGKGRSGRLWTWITAGGAAALLGTGVALAALAAEDHRRWEQIYSQENGELAAWQDLRTSGQDKQLAGNVLLGVGGAMAAAALALFFVEGRDAAQDSSAASQVRIRPAISAMPGLLLDSRF